MTKLSLLLSGGVLLGAAVFARQLGIDNDPGWGRGRVALAGLGVLLLAARALVPFARPAARNLRVAWDWLGRRRAFAAARSVGARWNHRRRMLTQEQVAVLASGSALAVVLFLYLFFITGGTLTRWTPYQAYFDRLANAFRAGQLALLETPDPSLLALKNPYDHNSRGSIDYIWDASLYDGKYYYYWGAVPALILAGVKTWIPVSIDDEYLVFSFCCGLAAVMALLLCYLRSRWFPTAPSWTLFPMVLLAGLAMPVFWLVNHPNVYETVIAGGQFFLVGGLYAAFRAVGGRQRPGWLILAGFAWGAAVNCRLSLAPLVVFFAALFGWRLLRERRSIGGAARSLAALGVPLLLWGAAMGWYNAARFGSLLETGHRYQLTGMALPGGDYSKVISLSYVLPNAYNYFFRLPVLDHGSLLELSLPFIEERAWPSFLRLPEHYYYSEQVAGLPVIVPALWLAFVPLLGLARLLWRWLNEQPPAPDNPAPGWLWLALAGGSAAAVAPLLVFISGSMRYLADVTPLAVLLATVGFWWGLWFLRRYPQLRDFLLLAGCGLALASALASLVVVFNSNDMRFEAIQPEIYAHFATLLSVYH